MDSFKARADELDIRRKQMSDANFDNLLQQPMFKLGLNMLAPSETPDLVRNLLRTAFDAGVGTGEANIMIEVLKKVMKDG